MHLFSLSLVSFYTQPCEKGAAKAGGAGGRMRMRVDQRNTKRANF